jgi:hypothetical protein
VYDDGRLLVHACGVITRVAVDIDSNRRVEANGNVVSTIGIRNRNLCYTTQIAVQELVEVAHGLLSEVKHDPAAGLFHCTDHA